MQTNETHPVFYLSYYDMIDMERTKMIMSICAQVVSSQKPEQLYFLFSSPGGNVESGIVLYNYLCALPVSITMHNIGSVGSIANVIFAAGETRLAAPHSTFHFHGVKMGVQKDDAITLAQLTELKSGVEADEKKIAGILQENSTLSEEEILSFFREGEAKDAAFAKEKGIVSKIVKPSIPKDAPHIAFDLKDK